MHNCINVLPGRKKNYVEAALGLDMKNVRNEFHWQFSEGTATGKNQSQMKATFEFSGEILNALEVINSHSPEGE